MKVALIFRRVKPLFFSIEKVYHSLLPYLSRKNEIVLLEVASPLDSLKGFIKDVITVARSGSNIVHITGEVYFLALFVWSKKLLITIHDCNYFTRGNGIKRKIIELFWFQLPVYLSDRVVAISSQTREEVIKFSGCSPDKVIIIPNPISDKFLPSEFLNNPKPVILQIGTRWNKNLDRVLQAVVGIDCCLFIVGPLNEKQKEFIGINNIQYENYINVPEEKLLELYIHADVLVFASLSEGFGLPIIEAQATGRPVITSDLAPMNNVAADSALFVNPESVDEIRKAINSLINNSLLVQELVIKGLNNVQRFKAEFIASEYEKLYESLSR